MYNSMGKQHIKQHDFYLLISISYFYDTIIFIDDMPSVSFLYQIIITVFL